MLVLCCTYNVFLSLFRWRMLLLYLMVARHCGPLSQRKKPASSWYCVALCVAEATRWKVFLAQLVGNHRFIISLRWSCLHQIPYIEIVTRICHRISLNPTIFTALKGARVSTLLTIEFSMKVRVWTNSLVLVPGLAPQPYQKHPQSTCQWFPSKSIIFPIRTAQCQPRVG